MEGSFVTSGNVLESEVEPGQQTGSKRPKSFGSTKRRRIARNPQSWMNRAIARASWSTVVTAEVACHAGGRRFAVPSLPHTKAGVCRASSHIRAQR